MTAAAELIGAAALLCAFALFLAGFFIALFVFAVCWLVVAGLLALWRFLMRGRKQLGALAALILAAVGLSACGLLDREPVTGPTSTQTTVVNVNVNPQASASPSPGAPGSGVTGPSDVASMGLFNYGKCSVGNPGVLEKGCQELLYTATPKTTNGTDAVNHGRNLTWTANGITVPDTPSQCVDAGPALVCAGPEEYTFNRTIKHKSPPRTGSFLLQARLIAPDGKQHDASAAVTVQ